MNIATTMASIYTPLEPSTSSTISIRLIEIDPDPDDQILSCRLTNATLSSDSNQTHFLAFSYMWGDASITEDILINGRRKAVTTNLMAALKFARNLQSKSDPAKPFVDSWLWWADAICINQDDIQERNAQVKLMDRIFASADLVFAYLDKDSTEPDKALYIFEQIYEKTEQLNLDAFCSLEWLKELPYLYEVDDDDDDDDPRRSSDIHWETLKAFTELLYWSRVWIFQETVLAKQLLLCTCLGRIYPYEMVASICEKLLEVTKRIREGTITCPRFLRGSPAWDNLATAYINPKTINHIKVARTIAEWPFQKKGGWLISRLGRRLRATDPKDHIYGLLSLTKLDVEVDYSEAKSVSDVYCDFVIKWLDYTAKNKGDFQGHSDLWFLCYGGVGSYENKLNLPSWAPNFPEESVKGIVSGEMVGKTDLGVFQETTPPPYILSTSLFAAGIYIDTINELEPALENEAIEWQGNRRRWLEGFFERNPTFLARKGSIGDKVSISPLRAIIDTFRLQPLSDLNETSLQYTLYFLICMWEIFDITPISVEALRNPPDSIPIGEDTAERVLNELKINSPGIRAIFQDYLEYMKDMKLDDEGSFSTYNPEMLQQVMKDLVERAVRWRLFETKNGEMGFCPAMTRLGDRLFVLNGFHLPIILRAEGDHYINAGPAFVCDLVSGEALRFVLSGERTVETIEIR